MRDENSVRYAASVGAFLGQGNIQKALQHLGFLRAGDSVALLHDETRHAVDTQAMGAKIIGMHRLGIRARLQEGQRRFSVESGRAGDGSQHQPLPDIPTLAEIGLENRLDHGIRRLVAPLRGPADQAMRVETRRHPADAFEIEGQPLRTAEIGDGRMQPARPFLAAEFPRHVILPRQAARADIRVQQERPPADIRQDLRPRAQRPPQPGNAQAAPGTHEVENDLDLQSGPGR